jgi:predicted RNase H-like HicB family nuclease
MKIKMTVPAKVPIQITKKAKWYVASCPVLDVATQGETEEVAKKNIVEALTMFMRSCVERGTIVEVLSQCGFKFSMEQDQEVEPSIGQEYVNIPLHLLSQYEENLQCHRV